MIGRLYAIFATLPGLMRIGLLIVLAGGMLDGIYHTLPLPWAAFVDVYLGSSGWALHLMILIGMVTTMTGIFLSRSSLQSNRHRRTGRSKANQH